MTKSKKETKARMEKKDEKTAFSDDFFFTCYTVVDE